MRLEHTKRKVLRLNAGIKVFHECRAELFACPWFIEAQSYVQREFRTLSQPAPPFPVGVMES